MQQNLKNQHDPLEEYSAQLKYEVRTVAIGCVVYAICKDGY